MAVSIRVDRGACRGAGLCIKRAPATFRLDDEDIATVIDPPGDDDAAIAEAARHCPHFAIEVTAATDQG